MSTEEIKVRIGLEGADQVQAGAGRAAQALGALDTSTRKFGQGAQLSGQQTAQLSAQLQDFAVQVQAGGSPLTAFLQQGSQLSAVFGGAGNALRAVTSLITPTTAAFGAAAAAIGTVAYAYAQGEAERNAFVRGIVTTGNAAGVTAGQLADLARAAQQYGATRGQGSDVLAQLVASGRMVGDVMAKATEAAVLLERNGVASVKDTVAAFSELGKEPVKALLRLNETQNFLTESTYKQVRALQDAGREAEAARVAQEAFASASIERGKQLEQSVGSLARGWRDLKREVLGALDAITSIGADKGPQSAMADIDRRLAGMALRLKTGRRTDTANLSDFMMSQGDFEAEAQALTRLRAQLQAGAETAKALGDAQAARTAATKAQIEADEKAADAAKKHAEELRRLLQEQVKAGTEQMRAGDLQDAGFSADFLKKWQELNAAFKAGGGSLEAYERAHQRLIAEQPVFKKQQDEINRSLKDAQAARERDAKAAQAQAAASAREVEQLREQYVLLTGGKEALRQYLETRQEDAVATAEQALQSKLLAGASAEEVAAMRANIQNLRDQLALRRAIAGATADQTTAEWQRKAAEEDQAARQRLFDDYRSGLTEAFRSAFSQGGNFASSFAKALGDQVKQRLEAALAATLSDAVLALLLGGSTGSGAGGTSGASGAAGWVQGASTLQNVYNLYNGAGGGLGGTMALANYANVYSGTAYGTSFGSQQSAMLAAQESGMVNASTASWGAYAGYAAMIYAASQYASSLYDKGWTGSPNIGNEWWYQISPENGKNSLLKGLGMSDKWAEILSSSVRLNHMFGYSAPKIEASGVQGTLSGGNFSGQLFADVKSKAGWVSSLFGADDKKWTELQALPNDLARFFSDASASVYQQAATYGKALGLPSDMLAQVSTDIKVTLTDDAEKNKEEIAKSLGLYGDALVSSWKEAVAPVALYGEDTWKTIARVGASLQDVNAVLKALGMTAIEASVAGGAAAISLQTMFGGQQGLQQSASGFLQNYYSDQERKALVQSGIGQTLESVGLSMPGTRAELRAMVDDLVKAGALMTDTGRQQVATLLGVSDAFASITRSAQDIATERDRIQMDIWKAQGNDAAIKAYDRSQIAPENLALYDQLQTIREQANTTAAAAAEKAEADRQAAAAASSMAAAAAEAARQIEAAAQAWATAGNSLIDEVRRLRGLNSLNAPASSYAAAQSQFALTAAQAQAGSLTAAQQLPTLSRDLVTLYEQIAASTGDLALFRARTAATLEEVLRRNGLQVPAFASGGLHAGGLRLVGENGPELQVTGPARIYSAEQTRDLLQGGGSEAVVAELRASRQELQAVRADNADMRRHLRDLAESNDRLLALLADVTDGGEAIRTVPLP